MARPEKVFLGTALAVLTVVVASACSSALAQTDEESAASLTEPNPIVGNLYLQDGGQGICEQINIVGNNCVSPNEFPVACCKYYLPPSSQQLQGPFCIEYSGTTVKTHQVGKGFCCDLWESGYGPTDWVRFEDDVTPCDFCGGKTPSPTECCTRSRDIVPAYPVTDPTVCPDLQQDPDHQPSITVPPCGSKEMADNGIHIPQEIGPVIFSVACGFHDECYSTCNKNDPAAKAQCDARLGADLSADCAAYWQPAINSAKNSDDRTIARGGLSDCLLAARVYFLAVSDKLPIIGLAKGGQSAYDKAQHEVCRCCKGGPGEEVVPP